MSRPTLLALALNLDPRHPSYAKRRPKPAVWARGRVVVKTPTELTEALAVLREAQKKRVTTFIEVILNQELGEPRSAATP